MTKEKIEEIVTNFYEMEPLLLHTKTRKRQIVEVRQICIYLFLKHLPKRKINLEKAGGYFNLDYSTAIHAKKKISGYCEVDRYLKQDIDTIEKEIQEEIKKEESQPLHGQGIVIKSVDLLNLTIKHTEAQLIQN